MASPTVYRLPFPFLRPAFAVLLKSPDQPRLIITSGENKGGNQQRPVPAWTAPPSTMPSIVASI